jgi:membrane protein
MNPFCLLHDSWDRPSQSRTDTIQPQFKDAKAPNAGCVLRVNQFGEYIRVNLVLKVWNRLNSDDCADLAAQVSFYFVLSLFPFFLVLASLLGWIPTTNRWETFADWVTTYFPWQARILVLTTMIQLSHGYAGFLSFGLLATIWTASSGFMSLMEALSVAYGAPNHRSYLKRRAIAICATLVAALFILFSFALWNLGHLIAVLVSHDLQFFVLFQMQWRFARWLATLLLLCVGINLINHFLPAVRRPWKWLTPGTLLVALSFVGAPFAFEVYLAHGSNVATLYGALAGFIVLMLWIYLGNLILLIGAETDSVLRERKLAEASA